MPAIEAKLASGWSYGDIEAGLRQLGVTVAGRTLRNYVARARRRQLAKQRVLRRPQKTVSVKPGTDSTSGLTCRAPARKPKREFAGFDESP